MFELTSVTRTTNSAQGSGELLSVTGLLLRPGCVLGVLGVLGVLASLGSVTAVTILPYVSASFAGLLGCWAAGLLGCWAAE